MNQEKAGNLNEKELVFCRLIEQGKSPSQAALGAGYANSAYGAKLMQKEKIQNEIARPEQKKEEAPVTVAANEEILEFLTNIMRGDEYEERKDSIIKDRMRAAELLGKRLKLFENSEEGLETQIVIVDDINTKQRDRGGQIETKGNMSFTGDG